MGDTTSVDVNWRIDPAEEVPGNGANRFDAQRQSTTFGPQPPTDTTGPEETNGGGGAPEAS